MNEQVVYNFAYDILSTITKDINEEIYSELGGKLTLTWSTEPIFQASASSSSSVDTAPNHTICIHYELVKQLYADAMRFELFANNLEIQKDIKKILDNIIEIPIFPESIDKQDAINNMFISCLTWIYFHELGHLYQEHGFIREKFGLVHVSEQTLEEQYVINSEKLTFQQSKISHITEIAADHFGTTMCCLELFRHFSPIQGSDLINPDSNGEEFIESTYMFLIGISSTLYRFYGEKILQDNNLILFDDVPKGSHPNPIIRLELINKHIIELIDLTEFKAIANYNMSKEKLVKIFARAIYTGAFLWIIRNIKPEDFSIEYISLGILISDEKLNYMKTMVQAWMEIEQKVLEIERHSIPFGTLSFSSQFIQLLDSAATFKTP